MVFAERIERAMQAALSQVGRGGPQRLAGAMVHAVTPGGARIRPTILLSVAKACDDDRPELSDAAAVALELIHCASLVHDDLPCFDDADIRRGKPTIHKAYSEPLAVLTGDALILKGFEVIAEASGRAPDRALQLTLHLARRTVMPDGICAGQGWESEPEIDLSAYHRAKTAALFCAATQMGALAAGHEAEPWEELGARIGEAFQVADDLRDALCSTQELGKPAGQDDRHGRPSAVTQYGLRGAVTYLDDILAGAIASIPSCTGEAALAQMVRAYADRIVPRAARERRSVPGE